MRLRKQRQHVYFEKRGMLILIRLYLHMSANSGACEELGDFAVHDIRSLQNLTNAVYPL